MTDTTTTDTIPAAGTTDTPAPAVQSSATHEEAVPFERFQQVNRRAKEAADQAKKLQAELADLRRQIEDRDNQGLPELEQTKRRLEQAERRAQEHEQRATHAEHQLQRAQKERWVAAAAQQHNFQDPSDAAAFLDLDQVDDEKDAERAVKRLAAAKKHLLRSDDQPLPGRVLQDGRQPAATTQPQAGGLSAADRQWAEEVAPQLKKMIGGWSSTSS
jgi:chromosome segregation ATPase